MRAAIYARKSTEQHGVSEDQRSVARQVAHGREYATRKGWRVLTDHVYVDDGISGAEFARRPGFVRLLAAVETADRPFDVIIMSEESRLGREAIETAYALKRIMQAGVRTFYYLEDRERTLDSPTDKLLMSVTAFADELEREKARQRVSDAMRRKARAGHVTGGRCFGYDNVPVVGPDGRRTHVIRRINPAEGEAIRRVFELCAEGHGWKGIAHRLNVGGFAAPRPQQGRPYGWAPSSVREALYRDVYRGHVVYNKRKKRDGWGRIKGSARGRDEWIERDDPTLAIVTPALWAAAHAQIGKRRAVYCPAGQVAPFQRPPTGGTTKYLLSGLTRCAVCGAGMVGTSRAHGKHRSFRYHCFANHTRGVVVCSNSLEVPMERADAALLDLVLEEVLRPEVVEKAIAEAVAVITATRPDTEQRIAVLEHERERLDAELANLTAIAAAGGDVPSVVARLRESQVRRDELAARIAALRTELHLPSATAGAVSKALRAKIRDLRALLEEDRAGARRVLEALLADRMKFTPNPEAGRYVVDVPIDLETVMTAEVPIGVASPTGFEPVLPA